MTDERCLPVSLIESDYFSKNEFVCEMEKEYALSKPQIAYDLQKRLDEGSVFHVGWDKYTALTKKRVYSHDYSEKAKEIVSKLDEKYIGLKFQIFELVQLNMFVNHLIAHNTIFVSVENNLQESVFDTLKDKYPGKVMLRPSLSDYYRYVVDDEIIVVRLPSESPKGIAFPWASRIEKIIVDVLADKLVGGIVPEGEKGNILYGAYEYYFLDEDTMFRYAKRKGAVKKFQDELKKYKAS